MTTETIRTAQKTSVGQPAEAATMEQFMATPYYQSLGIEGLKEQLAGYNTDDGALRAQAEADYRPAYEAESEAIRQQTERQIQGYDSQRAGVSAAYDRQRRQTNEAYDESAVDLNNTLTKRGLGRSSLVSTQGAYLENQRNRALSDLSRGENDEIAAINEKIALLTDQAAQSERTLAGNYARQLESRIGELREKRRSAAVDLQLQIAALQQQGYEAYQEWLKDQRSQELKEMEFTAKYGGDEASSGGGSSSGGKGKTASGAQKTNASAGTGKTLAGLGQTVGGILTGLLGSLKGQLTASKGGGTSGTGGTTAPKAASAKRQAARE